MTTNGIGWEAKLLAISGLGEAKLKMITPGAWVVDQPGVEIKLTSGVVEGGAVAKDNSVAGKDPEDAVSKRWDALTNTEDAGTFVEHKRGRLLRRVRWNGFMWADLVVEADAEPAAPATK